MFHVAEGHLDVNGVIGAVHGVELYSNGNDTVYTGERNFVNGVSTGTKWQSVEFARRFLLLRKNVLLGDVTLAADMLEATAVNVETAEPVNRNTDAKPTVGSIAVWTKSEKFPFGHVAVVAEVTADTLRIAAQNFTSKKFAEGVNYTAELKQNADGKFAFEDGVAAAGFVTFDAPDRADVTAPIKPHASLLTNTADEVMLLQRHTFIPKETKAAWLDETDPAQKQFIKTFGMDLSRTRLDEAEANYYEANTTLINACHSAGLSLHRAFLAATEKVLASDELMEKFCIPKRFWSRIRNSYKNQPYAISGRFDFALSEDGKVMKTFEYNADSASTLLECSVIQEKWAQSVGLAEGSVSSGVNMDRLLLKAWEQVINGGVVAKGNKVHFCVDNDDEEQYTALYVASGAKRAGLETELHVMFDDFEWRNGAVVEKKTGEKVKTVWKTWAWETAISDINQAEADGVRGEGIIPKDGDAVRLCDILLGDENISVFEPMWKLIPSNKAILPILTELFPDHPNLLRTEWTLTPELMKSGYAKKPIVGRTGQNVTVVDEEGKQLDQSEGKFSERDHVYQELFKLPKRDDYFAIMGGWVLGAVYAGTGIREDKSIITNVESPFSAIRIKY